MSPITRFLDTSPTVEEVAQKIEDLREDIRILEGYRNARFLIVSRLPTEVLSMIFEYVANTSYKPNDCVHNPYACWLPVSQVCCLWRHVAINTPRIWGTIYIHSRLELATLFLERSKSASLRVLTSAYHTQDLDVVTLWFSHGSQLRTINLNFMCEPSLAWPTLFRTLRVPNLETLCVTACYPTDFEFATEVDGAHIPLLREVELTDCSFNLQTPFLSQVRSLTIKYDEITANCRPMPQVMLALRDMKHLEHLELAHFLEFSGDIPVDLFIELPRLKALIIKSKDPRIVLMLQSFACANIQSIVADTTTPVESYVLAKRIAVAFRSILPNTLFSTRLKVHYTNPNFATTLFVYPKMDSPIKSSSVSRLQLCGPIDYSTCLALTSVFPESPPKSLDFNLGKARDLPIAYDRLALINFMRSLDSIEELTISTVHTLLIVLSDVPDETEVNKAGRGTTLPLALPSLKRIDVMQRTHLGRHDKTLNDLQKALERRRWINAGIDALGFEKSFKEDKLEIFRSEVKTLEHISHHGVRTPL